MNDNCTDGNSPSPEKPEMNKQKPKRHLTKKGKIIIAVAAVLGFILILLAAVAIFANSKLNKLNTGGDVAGYPESELFDSKIYEEDDFTTIDSDVNSHEFKSAIKEWATNGGDIMHSKNVLNVLIVGFDSRQNVMEGNTDVIMLASLNKKTKQVTLTSFLRDTYVYYDDGDGNTGYSKINSICNNYGINTLMDALENHYKVEINHYVTVNFGSFTSLVDEMGGINVTVQKYESDYFSVYFKGETIPYGDNVLIDGFQALGFCRIRKCDADGDVSRTRRQRAVIEAIIDKVADASVLELNKYLDAVLPYISTDFSKSNILSLGTMALTGKWYSYDIQEMTMPTAESREGYEGSSWVWAIDFPLAAQALQNGIYGMTNIELTEGRTTIIDLLRGRGGTGEGTAQYVPLTTDEFGVQDTEVPITGYSEPVTSGDTTSPSVPVSETEPGTGLTQESTTGTAPEPSTQSPAESQTQPSEPVSVTTTSAAPAVVE